MKELAAQTNDVATMLLNGEIGIEIASRYSNIARTTAQLMSIETMKARYDKRKVNLNFNNDTEAESNS